MKIKHQNILLSVLLSAFLLSCQQSQDVAQNTKTMSTDITEAAATAAQTNSVSQRQLDKPTNAHPQPVIEEEPVPKPTKVALQTKHKEMETPAVKQSKPIRKSIGPKINFKQAVFNFGEITEGDIIKHQFTFTNTGDKELEILSAYASCGCTDPSYPFLGIAPGEEGVIGVTYNSVSKEGPQQAEVIIKTNATSTSYKLFLMGTVNPKPTEDSSKVDSSDMTRAPNYPVRKS